MKLERQANSRIEVYRTGTLFFAEGRQCLDCLVWNFSAGGALIEVDDAAEVAQSGRLISEAVHLDRAYSVVWRRGRKVDVAFTV